MIGIDTVRTRLEIAGDACAQYDTLALALALGSRAFRLPLPGANLPGALMYRTLDEVPMMLDVAKGGGRAVVIGGGVLGLEAAVGLA